MIASTKFNFIYRIETKAITLNQDDWRLPTHQNVGDWRGATSNSEHRVAPRVKNVSYNSSAVLFVLYVYGESSIFSYCFFCDVR